MRNEKLLALANTAKIDAQSTCTVSDNLGTSFAVASYLEDEERDEKSDFVESSATIRPDADPFTSKKVYSTYFIHEGNDDLSWAEKKDETTSEGATTSPSWDYFTGGSDGIIEKTSQAVANAKKYRCGNCDAMSAVAFENLKAKKVAPLDIIKSAEHTFVVIGRSNRSGEALRNPEHWGKDCIICDPWADIVCYASDYHFVWTSTMKKWHVQARRIKNKNEQWISPLAWLEQSSASKQVFTSYYPTMEWGIAIMHAVKGKCLVSSNLATAVFKDADRKKIAWIYPDADKLTSDLINLIYRGEAQEDNTEWVEKKEDDAINKDKISKYSGKKYQFKAKNLHAREPTLSDAAQLAEQYRCGNCDIMVAVAYMFAVEHGISPVEIIEMDRKHTIIAIGRNNSNYEALQNFGLWGKECVICDPWANIICLAEEYPQRWQETMDAWAKQCRLIGIIEHSKRNWVSPLYLPWYLLINNPKRLMASDYDD